MLDPGDLPSKLSLVTEIAASAGLIFPRFPCSTGVSSPVCIFSLSSMVSSYLVHHGYCSTATAFARVTDTTIQEEQTSIKNRQSKSLAYSFPTCWPRVAFRTLQGPWCCGSRRAVPRQHKARHSTLLGISRAWGLLPGSTLPIITVSSTLCCPLPALSVACLLRG